MAALSASKRKESSFYLRTFWLHANPNEVVAKIQSEINQFKVPVGVSVTNGW
jgi:hypothetical protein